jgi:hypothetical protein
MTQADGVFNTPRTDSSPFRLSERELDPKDVLTDLFGEELPLDDPARVAEMVIERLRDAGFEIKPAEKEVRHG